MIKNSVNRSIDHHEFSIRGFWGFLSAQYFPYASIENIFASQIRGNVAPKPGGGARGVPQIWGPKTPKNPKKGAKKGEKTLAEAEKRVFLHFFYFFFLRKKNAPLNRGCFPKTEKKGKKKGREL